MKLFCAGWEIRVWDCFLFLLLLMETSRSVHLFFSWNVTDFSSGSGRNAIFVLWLVFNTLYSVYATSWVRVLYPPPSPKPNSDACRIFLWIGHSWKYALLTHFSGQNSCILTTYLYVRSAKYYDTVCSLTPAILFCDSKHQALRHQRECILTYLAGY